MDALDEISKATTDFLTAGCPWPGGVPKTSLAASEAPRGIKIEAEAGLQKYPGVRVSAPLLPGLRVFSECRAAFTDPTDAALGLAYDNSTVSAAVAHDVLQHLSLIHI